MEQFISFLSNEEQNNFNKLFCSPRTICDEKTGVENSLYMFLRTEIKYKDKGIGRSKYFDNKTQGSFAGIWIHGEKEDGISWFAEKILRHFQNEKYDNIHILKNENRDNKLPAISELFKDEKTIIECAVKAKLVMKSKSGLFFLSILSTINMGFILGFINLCINKSLQPLFLVLLGILTLIVIIASATMTIKTIKNKEKEKEKERKDDLINK